MVWHYDDPLVHWDDPLIRYDDPGPLPRPMAENNITYPVTEVLGFCDAVVAMLNTHKTAMIATGVDPTAIITTIGAKRDTLNTQNTTQESLKTQLRDQTAVVQTANSDAYHRASNGCDRLIDAFGNTSEQAKEARNLRKSFQHAHRTPATPTPTPTP
jgi:hypothetical protein